MADSSQNQPGTELEKMLQSMTQGVDYVRACYLALSLVFMVASALFYGLPDYRLHTGILSALCIMLGIAVANL